MVYEEVKKRIVELCAERNMSLNKLANVSGLHCSSLKNILYGRSTNPGIVTIKILCDGFGITLAEFFNTDAFNSLEQEVQ